LLRRHGATAVVIYTLLSGLDLGITWATIYAAGADRVKEFEDFILHHLNWKRVAPTLPKDAQGRTVSEQMHDEIQVAKDALAPKTEEEKAEGERKPQSIFWTTFALAYAIHKTVLFPFRLGVTAAVTPKVVRALRARGWNVG
ncbi:hypothetical protein BT69DRAFT_1207307, partial [Atractiella rhizophila]